MSQKKNLSPDKDDIRGKYANFFKVGYNAYEFLIDFCRYYPSNDCRHGNEKAELCQRVVTSPAYAKALLIVLEKSIKEYENTFGNIEDEENHG